MNKAKAYVKEVFIKEKVKVPWLVVNFLITIFIVGFIIRVIDNSIDPMTVNTTALIVATMGALKKLNKVE